MKTLYLVDISSFIFRAFYAIRPLHAPSGEPTNAVFGVLQMMLQFLEATQPEHVVVAFDSKEPSLRKAKYDAYKANRTEPPEELKPQFELVTEMLTGALKLPYFRGAGVEADDWIASLTRDWLERGPDREVVILSGDKDLMQLVNSRVTVWDTMKQVRFTPHEVEEKFGVTPSRVRDYLALIGDSSDNIPGLPGVGPKTAVQWLSKVHDHLELLSVAQDPVRAKEVGISESKRQLILEHADLLKLSYELVGLDQGLDVADHAAPEWSYVWKDIRSGRTDGVLHALIQFCERLGFQQQVRRLREWLQQGEGSGPSAIQGGAGIARDYETIRTSEQLLRWVEEIERTGALSIDCETTSLQPHRAKMVGVSMATRKSDGTLQAGYIPVAHQDPQGSQLSWEAVREQLRPLLAFEKIKKIGQNLKYDTSVLQVNGVVMGGVHADTMIASWCLDAERRHNLEALAERYLQLPTLTFEDVCGKGAKQITFDAVPVDVATRYSAEDAHYAWMIWDKLEPELVSAGLMQVFQTLEMPMIQVLSRMELTGVRIDEMWLAQLSEIFAEEMLSLEKRVRSFSKTPDLNLASPKQLQVFLFEELGLPTQTRTKTGYSTDAEVLALLAPLHEVPQMLLEYREIAKLQGTYVDPLPKMLDPTTGRLHTSFHQTGTATGRLSSSDPNLQNIPIRTRRGEWIRKAFVPQQDWRLISADYSQIELRVLAELSGDVELSRAFLAGEDVHRQTASEIFLTPISDVTEDQRRIAKAINFGLMYGKTAFGLAKELGISRKEAEESIQAYFRRYSGVKRYLDQLVADARKSGVVTSLLGRRRQLKDIHSKNVGLRNNAERMAMNSPIQGTAADLMKMAMLEVDRRLRVGGLQARLLLQVHDELVLEAPPEEVPAVLELVRESMENVARSGLALERGLLRQAWTVPLSVNLSSGLNWLELE